MTVLAAQRGRIAAFTAAALLTLFAGQPLHGADPGIRDVSHAAAGIAADPGVATPGSHDSRLCPLCQAANQTRVSIAATPPAVRATVSLHPFSLHAVPAGLVHVFDLCASGPRAPPRLLSSLV